MIVMNMRKVLQKLINQYRNLKNNEDLFPTLNAWAHFVRSIFYRLFRKEEYYEMIFYDFMGFKHPDIYKTIFNREDNAELLPLVNDEAELPVLRQKHRLLQLLDNVGRRYFYVPDHSEEEFAAFFLKKEKGKYILKPDAEAGSRGFCLLYTDGQSYDIESEDFNRHGTNLKELYQDMKGKNILIEEYIQQHERLNMVFDGCVNTIYIHTVRLPDGHVEVAGFLYAGFGCGESRYVNNDNDLMVGIHDDGTLYSFGFLRKNGHYDLTKVMRHPDSGVVLDGFRIPYWKEAVRLALNCAEKIPQLVYIKWDIAISDKGPIIIEGNGMPASFSSGQTYSLEARHIGVRAELTEFLQALAFSKTLTPKKIQEINQKIMRFDEGCGIEECDAVVVLGSARATSRIETAFRSFGHNPDMRYILCGGNTSIHPKNSEEPDGEKLTESEYMKRYLLECGVREEQIITDNMSKNTKENLNCAAAEIARMGVKKVAIVSSWFHGRRVGKLLSKSNNLWLPSNCVCFVPAYGEDTKPDNWFRSLYGIKAIYHEWKNC